MFIQDLYLLAFDSAEIRTPLLHIKGEIFRKGFDEWKPKFAIKCIKCGDESKAKTDTCLKCGSGELREPDKEQYKEFDKLRKSCNIFGQDLESIFNILEDDVNICLVPGTLIYRIDGKRGQGYKPIETLKVGDKVYTHTGKARCVTKVYTRQINEDLVVLSLENGEIIKITHNHPVYTKRGWVKSGDLLLSDILYKISDVRKFSNNMTPEERYQKCAKPGAISRTGKKRGKYDCVSPKKGLSLAEYYGDIVKAQEIIDKMRQTKERRGCNIGAGFNFRSKVGSFIGFNNPNWKGGKSYELYGDNFTKDLKRKVFERDNFTCQECSKYPTNDLNTHHIDYDKKNNLEYNLITLCGSCHPRTNWNRKYWAKHFSDLMCGKYIAITNGTRILKVAREHYAGIVYNLEVEEDHSYVGRGIIYHNCDDAYIFLNKNYLKTNNKIYSKIEEIRRIHPALLEFDLDKAGLPKNSHWLCPFHREKVEVQEGECVECKTNLKPAMYVWNHRGQRIYLFQDELIHSSKFSSSETYGYCYDDETQILTKSRGWQFFKDINNDDLVATLNPENNNLIYQKPKTIWSQKYSGKMYELGDRKTKLVSLKITPNHKHYVKVEGQESFSLQEASLFINKRITSKIGGAIWGGAEKELFTLDEITFYRGGSNWKIANSKTDPELNLVHYPEIKISMDLWLEFLGYYLSEGNLHIGKNSKQVMISQNFKTEKWEKIKECLEKLGFPFRYYGHKFIIEDVRIHNYLVQFGKVHDKFIPEEFKDLSQRQLRILLNSLMLGDGSWREYPKSGSYKSVSKRLLEDVTEIIMKLGYSSRLWSYDKYGVSSASILFTDKETIELNKGKKSDTLIDYSGNIYCCEVPEYNILLVRRKGRTIFSGNSPILTIMQKVLTISGMDRFLYRYFFERKTPTQMILTSTDDPQSLEIERARIESKMMEDPTYTPWIAVSARTQRGRTDVVKLWHTLQEMDYLNVRNEIRDRVAAIYGVPQLYMNVMEGVGGLSGQTQQMKVFSNVIEADQRRYNEKIFPILLKEFGITDWEIKLRTPEEKIESVILQMAQQKVMIAGQMMQMGFDIKLKPGAEDIETLDFEFSGEAINPQKQQMEMMEQQQQQMAGVGGQEEIPQEGIASDNMPENMPRNINPKSGVEEKVFKE